MAGDDRELGLVITNLEITVAGETIPLIDHPEIAHLLERNDGDSVDAILKDYDHIDHLHGSIEVWEEGEVVQILEMDWDDIDVFDFWHVFYEALREAYEGSTA